MNHPTKAKLYLVGAPKAGSSALANLLAQHPQISMCRIKEPNFHCHDFQLPGPKTEQEYLSLFSITPQTKFMADASILYLYSRSAAAAIAEYAPQAHILMILRNPVEAMYSWHSQMVFTGNEPITDFEKAIDAESERKQGRLIPQIGTTKYCPELLFYGDIMRYYEQIERYFSLFARQKILILFYDDFKNNPILVYQKTLKFLGLDESFLPQSKNVNPSKVRRNLKLHYLLKKIFAEPARILLPAELRLNLINFLDQINSREARRLPMDPKLEKILKDKCMPDIIQLGNLLGRDLKHWCH